MRLFDTIQTCIPLSLLAYFQVTLGLDTPQTIASLDAYDRLRTCAQNCFWYGGAGGAVYDGIAGKINCKMQGMRAGALDSCWCRGDLQTSAEVYLSTCISSRCSSIGGDLTLDIASGVSLYDNYCTSKGYIAATQSPQSVAATTTPTIKPTSTTSSVLPTASTSGTKSTSTSGGYFESSDSSTLIGFSTPPSRELPSSTTLSISETSTLASNPSNKGGWARQDTLTIIFGILALLVAVGIGIWQGRKGSIARKKIESLRSTVFSKK